MNCRKTAPNACVGEIDGYPRQVKHITKCPACGAGNRVSVKHLAKSGKCGACAGNLPPLAHPLSVNAEEFAALRAEAQVPLVIDFWAEWCGPCRMVAPEYKKAAAVLAGRAILVKINSDQEQALAASFNVSGIPAFAVVKDGETVASQAGARPAAQLVQWIESAIGAS